MTNRAHRGLRGSEEETWSAAIVGIITLIPLMRGWELSLKAQEISWGQRDLHDSLPGPTH